MSVISDSFPHDADHTADNGEFPLAQPPAPVRVQQYALVIPKAYGGFGWRLCDEKGHPSARAFSITGHFYSREAVMDFLVAADVIPVVPATKPMSANSIPPGHSVARWFPNCLSYKLEVELVFAGELPPLSQLTPAVAVTLLRATANRYPHELQSLCLVRVSHPETNITNEARQPLDCE